MGPANTAMPAHRRDQLERLMRYTTGACLILAFFRVRISATVSSAEDYTIVCSFFLSDA